MVRYGPTDAGFYGIFHMGGWTCAIQLRLCLFATDLFAAADLQLPLPSLYVSQPFNGVAGDSGKHIRLLCDHYTGGFLAPAQVGVAGQVAFVGLSTNLILPTDISEAWGAFFVGLSYLAQDLNRDAPSHNPGHRGVSHDPDPFICDSTSADDHFLFIRPPHPPDVFTGSAPMLAPIAAAGLLNSGPVGGSAGGPPWAQRLLGRQYAASFSH